MRRVLNNEAAPSISSLALVGACCGYALTVPGALESTLVHTLGLNHGLAGLSQSLFFVGTLVGSLVAAALLASPGWARVASPLALATLAVGSLLSAVPSYAALLPGRVGAGIGLAATMVVISARIVAGDGLLQGRLLNMAHGCLALGAAAALASARPLAGLVGGAWLPLALPGALAAGLALAARRTPTATAEASPGGGLWQGLALLGRWPFAVVLLLMVGYMVMEQGTTMFAASMLEQVGQGGGSLTGATVALLWIGVGAGRLISSAAMGLRRFSEQRQVLAGLLLGAVSISLSLVMGPGPVGTAGLLLGGIFIGPVIPLCFSMVGRLAGDSSGPAMGVANAASGLGGAAGPLVIGLLSDSQGLQAGMAAGPAIALLLSAPMVLEEIRS